MLTWCLITKLILWEKEQVKQIINTCMVMVNQILFNILILTINTDFLFHKDISVLTHDSIINYDKFIDR